MTIRDLDAYRDAAWDWACFKGCFAGRIRPMDVDGLIERRGHVLMLEAKGPRGTLGEGQRLTFVSLTKKPLIDAVVFRGTHETLEVTEIDLFHRGQQLAIKPADFDRLYAMVAHWFAHANSGATEPADWSGFLEQSTKETPLHQ